MTFSAVDRTANPAAGRAAWRRWRSWPDWPWRYSRTSRALTTAWRIAPRPWPPVRSSSRASVRAPPACSTTHTGPPPRRRPRRPLAARGTGGHRRGPGQDRGGSGQDGTPCGAAAGGRVTARTRVRSAHLVRSATDGVFDTALSAYALVASRPEMPRGRALLGDGAG